MTQRTSVQQSLAAMVACDQSYLRSETGQPVKVGDPLQVLPDRASGTTTNQNLYTDTPAFAVPGGYTVAAIIDRPEVGAKAVIYKNATTNETLVAFGGTDGINAQDYVSNTQSYGWSQWEKLAQATDAGPSLFDKLAELQADAGTIHFTGQSLGGALAQYATASYIASKKAEAAQRGETYTPSNIGLTTFNGLGGKAGLAAAGLSESLFDGLGYGAHYAVYNDIPSRLGGGHAGTDGEVIQLPWIYLDGPHTNRPMNIGDSHRIETAFYTHLEVDGSDLTRAMVVTEGSSSFSLIDTPNAVYWANAIGNFGNTDGESAGAEALLRLIAGAVAAGAFGDRAELGALIRAVAEVEYSAGEIGETVYAALTSEALVSGVQLLSTLLLPSSLTLLAMANILERIREGSSNWGTGLLALELGISPESATAFTLAAHAAPARRNPLTLDLDGDGLETLGIDPANPILFDHDADGVKAATGWVRPDDGFLVLDRNGNGSIDTGRELFGDATPLYAGGHAADGFAALAQEDTNHDGRVDGADSRFAQLRLWRDLNQDGTSQAGELQTLAQAGIAALLVAKSENAVVLANGNQIADLGGYLRSDGVGGTLGASEQLADIDLASNPFYSEFADAIPLTEAAQDLPELKGAGQVRRLREAASLDTDAGRALATELAAWAAEPTRAGQMARLDGLIAAWAATSTMATTTGGAYAGVELGITVEGLMSGTPAYQAWLDRLAILERFNGQTFLPVPAPGTTLRIDFYNTRVALLDQAWAALRDSVYGALALQTRLAPRLDAIRLTVDEAGVALDYAAVDAQLGDLRTTDPRRAVGDLVDLVRFAGDMLDGWGGDRLLSVWARDPAFAGEFGSALSAMGLVHPQSWQGGLGDEVAAGGSGNDALTGHGGNDRLFGLAGNDTLQGRDGSDALDGGGGNDLLDGGTGDDVFVFARGGGYDDVYAADSVAGKRDTLRLDGLLPDEVRLEKWGSSLAFVVKDTGEWLRVLYFFDGPSYQVEAVRFADDTVWDKAALLAQTMELRGGPGDDVLAGHDGGPNLVWGNDGNDTALGGDRADTLRGGNGNDNLVGMAGDDQLFGEAGNDTLQGRDGSDTLEGGSGNDLLDGGTGDDVFVFARGRGYDDVYAADSGAGKRDTLRLDGLLPDEVRLEKWGSSLAFFVKDTGEWLRVLYFFDGPSYQVEAVRFADDTVWDKAALLAQTMELRGGPGDDVLAGHDGGPNLVWGNDGNDTALGGDRADTLRGGNGNDNLVGLAGDDQLFGEAGNDTLQGRSGNDVLDGGSGNDTLIGEAGNDTYVLGTGSGIDIIYEGDVTPGNVDTVRVVGRAPRDVSLARSGNSLVIALAGGTDGVTVQNYFLYPEYRIERVLFDDGRAWSSALLDSLYPKRAPVLVNPLPDRIINEDLALDFAVPATTFADADTGDALRLSATLADGASLPAWLSFDPATGRFAGTPGDGDVGAIEVRLMATDLGDLAAADVFRLTVANVNDAPTGTVGVAGTAKQGETLSADAALADADGMGEIAWRWQSSADGANWNDLAGANSANFVPGLAEVGLRLRAVAAYVDGHGSAEAVASAATARVAGGTNQAPGLVSPLPDLLAVAGRPTSLALPAGAFADPDGDALTLSASRGDGSPLPVWLGFDAGSGSFTMNAPSTSVGSLALRVSATDPYGAAASDDFILDIAAGRVGTAGNDTLTGTAYRDVIEGLAGDDSLNGGAGADILVGGPGGDGYAVYSRATQVIEAEGEGVDTVRATCQYILPDHVENLILTGGANNQIGGTGNALDNAITGNESANTLNGLAGNDTLDGGAGDDLLVGGTGDDTYVFGAGHGADRVRENDAGTGDAVRLLAGIAAEQIWLRRLGNDLEASRIGTTDRLTVENWYLGPQYRVEEFRTADGRVLVDSQVEALVQAMAGFAPPGAGETNLPPGYQETLAPLIAANWS